LRRLLFIGSSLLLLVLLAIAWWTGRGVKPAALTPALTGQVEYCLTCHNDVEEISPSHPVKTFGCVICHGGERLALEKDLAHSSMRGGANPADFSVVEASCGGANCHSGSAESHRDHIQRSTTSIQDTYAGAIALIRYTYGSQPDLTARLGTRAIDDPLSTRGITHLGLFDPSSESNPQVQLFGQNCLTCHLSARAPKGSAYARFTGCAACHTPTQPAEGNGSAAIDMTKIHKLTTAMPYTQCNTCHNRGNYELRSMTFQPRQDTPTDRLHHYYQPISSFTKCEYTLDCIDCHTRTEAMGDGSLYSSKLEVEYIQCKTCHGTLTELPQARTLTDPNDLAFKLATLNPVVDVKLGDTILVTDKGEPIWNSRVLSDGTYQMVGKVTGQAFTFRPVKGTACKQDPAEQSASACHECHTVQR
jgi:hypothetical protein